MGCLKHLWVGWVGLADVQWASSPAVQLANAEVLQHCCRPVHCSGFAVSLLFASVQQNLSYLNSLLENIPLLLGTCLSCFLMFIYYTGKNRGYINIWLSLMLSLHCCISHARCFPFLDWNTHSRLCEPGPLLCPLYPLATAGCSAPVWLGAPCHDAHPWGHQAAATTTGLPASALHPAALCLLAAMPLMKLLWTSLCFTKCEIFGIVQQWIYFVSMDVADINRDRMRPALKICLFRGLFFPGTSVNK